MITSVLPLNLLLGLYVTNETRNINGKEEEEEKNGENRDDEMRLFKGPLPPRVYRLHFLIAFAFISHTFIANSSKEKQKIRTEK